MATGATGQLQAPSISLDELQAFHTQHFPGQGQPPMPNFAHENAQLGESEYYEEDDDGLGYYPDGVKRTLTDEQIRIFRHSEIHAILRKRQLEEERRLQEVEDAAADQALEESDKDAAGRSTAKGPVHSINPDQTSMDRKTDASVPKSSGGSDHRKGDQGVSGLDYDDDSSYRVNTRDDAAAAAASRFAGRRIISYDD
ncbi:hypothetical protein DTO217A2_860 [Paecilomyces variotii]|nr:hypothetical protein DTO217A2_860 [Paecilomyces variotii]